MAMSETSENDPTSLVKANDILKDLYRYCNEALKEERNHFNACLKAESEHTNTIVTKIFHNLSDRIGAVNEVIKNYDVTLADMDLRIETTSLYHQEHLHSLKTSLQDVFQNIEKDMQSAMSDLQQMRNASPTFCKFCGKAFQTEDHLRSHVDNQHALSSDQYGQNSLASSLHNEPLQLQSCNFCSLVITSPEELIKHMVTFHGIQQLSKPQNSYHSHASQHYNFSYTEFQQVPQICDICHMLFATYDALESHMRTHEISTLNSEVQFLLCDICGTTCNNEAELNLHLTTFHTSSPSHACGKCGKTFKARCDLYTHIHDDHSAVQDLVLLPHSPQLSISTPSLSPIPQCDGAHSEDGDTTPHLVAHTSSSSTLRMPYQLNKQKQLAQLARDANIEDFDVIAKDNNRNICVQCSSGFYEAVVKPTFSSISNGFSHHVMGVDIICTVYRTALDRGASMPGLFLRFELSGPSVHPSPLPLSIHLHNTQRKIQIQGGSGMPDKSSAPTWFVENVLKPMFLTQSQKQGFEITKINRLVSNSATEELNSELLKSCYHCKKKFSTKSRPVSCNKCSNLKHATRCSPCPVSVVFVPNTSGTTAGMAVTMTNIPVPPVTSAAPRGTQLPPSLSGSTSSLISTANTSASVNCNTTVISSPVYHGPLPSATSSSVPPYPSAISTTQNIPASNLEITPIPSQHSPVLNPETNNHTAYDHTQTAPVSLPGPSVDKHTRQPKQKQKTGMAATKSDISQEFTKIEVNTMRAKIKSLEIKNKDLEFQNSLLLERVALLEKTEKEAIYSKYFPKNDQQQPPCTDGPPNTNTPGTQHCAPHTHALCCQWSHFYTPACSRQHVSSCSSHETILQSIAEIKTSLLSLASRVNKAYSETAHTGEQSGLKEPPGIADPLLTPARSEGATDQFGTRDDSVLTVDECVPDISEEGLNSLVLTTQPLQLRL